MSVAQALCLVALVINVLCVLANIGQYYLNTRLYTLSDEEEFMYLYLARVNLCLVPMNTILVTINLWLLVRL